MEKKIAFILFSFLAAHISGPAVAQEEPREITNRSTIPQTIDGKQYYLHAVLQGQTLYSIARAYHVDEEDIIEENPDIRDGLRYDQVIRIPVSEDPDQIWVPTRVKLDEAAPVPDGKYVEHEVQRQETLFGLSRQYGISMEKILFYNPDAREGLKIGQVLQIPLLVDDIDARAYQWHTVSPGETKYGISRAFGLTVEELESLNPDTREGLRAGQQIRIPADREKPVERVPAATEGYIFLPEVTRRREMPKVDEYCFAPRTRDEYQVALLIPLFLEEFFPPRDTIPLPSDTLWNHVYGKRSPGETIIVETPEQLMRDLPLSHPSFSFISYYHGVLLALDSIWEAGGRIKLSVYDVSQDLPGARKLVETGVLRDTDLIIGPFHRQTLNYIAGYGRRQNIPVISPMLDDPDQLRGAPNLFKVTPSLETMLDDLATYISRHYPKQNIILVHNDQPGAAPIISTFQDTLLTRVAMTGHLYDSLHLARVDGYYFDNTMVGNRRTNLLIMPDTATVRWLPPDILDSPRGRAVPRPANVREVIYRTEGIEGLLSKMEKDKNNVLITLIGGEPFLANYLRQLNEQRHYYNITVFGIPDWQDYTSIEIDYLQNLRVHYFTPYFYDHSEPHFNDFMLRYRQMFLTEPDQDAFKAAQTAYFFFNALLEYGLDFYRCMPLLNQQGHESPFSFEQVSGARNGWKNKHTSIYRIEGYRRIDVQRPIEVISQRTE